MSYPEFTVKLPGWVDEFISNKGEIYPSVEDRMELAVELSRMNIKKNTGGPFGAAVFNAETGKLIAPGVNMVMYSNCSVVHAEIVSIMMAQKVLGHYDLGSEGMPVCELVSSTEPCAMCCGAIFWGGVKHVVYACPCEVLGDIAGDDFLIPCRTLFATSKTSPVQVEGPVLLNEARVPHEGFWGNE